MKIRVRKASNWNYEKTVTINSMKELSDFIKKFGRIIIDEDIHSKYDLLITIYDYWIE